MPQRRHRADDRDRSEQAGRSQLRRSLRESADRHRHRWCHLEVRLTPCRWKLRRELGIDPADELHHTIAQLVDVHVHAGSDLTTAIYRYDKDPNGRWDMVARFSYAPDLSPNE
ncbi:hypothetical protein [Actinoallomurus sp. NPDC050550]|uniref:hypothetical protein n=1 Tax=Actinoallomurus sp. NPDC050550 TaxID=3154937 RepID=UPI00340F5C57